MSLKPLVELPLAPSRTRTVQSLSLALWAIPVLASSFYLAVLPISSDAVGYKLTGDELGPSATTGLVQAPHAISPVAGLMSGGATILPDSSFLSAAKGKRPERVREQKARLEQTGSGIAGARTIAFNDVRVIDATRINADGIVITLNDVTPLEDGSMCKRVDGIIESCAERAANRLVVLTQGRRLICKIWNSPSDSQPMGQCRADRLDIASDLIRHGLARANPLAAAGL